MKTCSDSLPHSQLTLGTFDVLLADGKVLVSVVIRTTTGQMMDLMEIGVFQDKSYAYFRDNATSYVLLASFCVGCVSNGL